MRSILILLSAAVIAGCASSPEPVSKPAAPVSAAAPAAAPAAVQAAPAAVSASAAAKPAGTTEERAPPGYRLAKRDGQTMYCKNAKVIGSNIARTVCMTPEQYKQSEEKNAEDRQRMQRNASMCGSASGVCGG